MQSCSSCKGLQRQLLESKRCFKPIAAVVGRHRPHGSKASPPATAGWHGRRATVVMQAGFGFGKAAPKKLSKQAACPCGSGQSFKECCRRYHDGEQPPTAEALMRARFSAYAKGNADFVVDTTHPDNPLYHGTKNPDGTLSSTLREDVVSTCENISWDKLKLLSAEDGSHPDEAYVTFQTFFKVRGQMGQRPQGFHTQSFIEKSRFLRGEDGRWLYVNGDQEWVKGGTGEGK